MEDNEKQESGMSLGEFFRITFSQKWLALIILVVVTLAGTLGIYFGKNAVSRNYAVSFTLELPQTELNTVTVKDELNNKLTTTKTSPTVVLYPDGTPFYYTDIVSIQTLRRVKYSEENKERFKDIDVEKMSTSGDISISRTINETANNSGTYESIYSLNVKASYFPSSDVARRFVEALTKTPTDYLSLMDIDHSVYINSAKVAPDYVTEISQLIAQCEYLIERYETFIEIYNDLSIDGKTLRLYCQEIKSYLNDNAELDIIQTDVRKGCYLKSEESKARYAVEYDKLQRQHEIADYTLQNLKEKGDSESISADVFKKQSDLVIELQKQMEEIYFKDEATGKESGFRVSNDYGENMSDEHKAFLVQLDNAYKQVQSYTDEFKSVISALYAKVSVVSYSNSNVIVTNGVTGLALSLIISFVVGLVLAIIVAFAVGWFKIKKPVVEAKENEQGKPAPENAQSLEVSEK